MKQILMALLLILSLTASANDISTSEPVDVSRYVGKWYAHYSLPQFFTRKCLGQTAEYGIINERTISVLNTCLKAKGTSTIRGKAVVQNPGVNSELIVTFDSFFTRLFRVKGDYNIIELDEDYGYVLVGSMDRDSLWIMSRSEREIPEEIKEQYLEIARELGFDVSKLVKSRF